MRLFITKITRVAAGGDRHFPSRILSACLLSLLVAVFQVQAATRIADGVIRPAWPGGQPPRASLAVQLVVLDGSGWRDEELAPLFDRVAGIYAQCGLALSRVDWQRLRVADELLDFSTPAAKQLVSRLQVARPAVFLVRDTRQRPAFDAEAIGRGNSRTRPSLRDTVWMTRALPHPDIGLAHELAHVLMNSGAHSELPDNLMRDVSAPGHTHLTSGQCAAMLEQGLAHGLIRRGPDPR